MTLDPQFKLIQQIFSIEAQLRSTLNYLVIEFYKVAIDWNRTKMKKLMKKFPMTINEFMQNIPVKLTHDRLKHLYNIVQKDVWMVHQ